MLYQKKKIAKNSGCWPPDFKIKSFSNQSKDAQHMLSIQKRKGACI
jgi:hypothetical protein